MKVELETKYQPGDKVWVIGRKKETKEIVPVIAKVNQTYLSKHSPEHSWLIQHEIQLIEDNDLCFGKLCLGFTYDDIEADGDDIPTYHRVEFESYMFKSRQEVFDFLNEDPF